MPKAHAWTEAEDALLGSAPDRIVAKLLAKSVDIVRNRRILLGIGRFRRTWSKEDDARLGTMTDHALASILGVSALAVSKRRKELEIAPWKAQRAFNRSRVRVRRRPEP